MEHFIAGYSDSKQHAIGVMGKFYGSCRIFITFLFHGKTPCTSKLKRLTGFQWRYLSGCRLSWCVAVACPAQIETPKIVLQIEAVLVSPQYMTCLLQQYTLTLQHMSVDISVFQDQLWSQCFSPSPKMHWPAHWMALRPRLVFLAHHPHQCWGVVECHRGSQFGAPHIASRPSHWSQIHG